ncbi:hypothetical protein BFU36_10135 [Sulfolobus sp. A20]|uniref:hypothetical protein n=1 Tax=Saccharolobus sp. A20 TaxID=1891280 RepID=UPI00084602B9|nr:hypothetical protein [Sulfolobus sp. A20]TRM77938.1 hypothetical protein DJ532_02540 [Sulfolobus sp. A20-N-F8]TRM81594.1 hypothetical protein DJ524_03565 [Sulfolobus sp. D5]TRM83430.1 hypothetical protein DJ531_05490 [Sulfolobus sp. A20-N-F6]TRM87947.1 hypothetical protein DJ529_06820 [Sulfolobus sp. C3]TRM88810.1 hypothetical protein DJ521_01150 [Sulfolobus sp. E3]TRN04119.1 hypothetical protein DJ530_01530 [Sulfolobus sp. E1]
MFKMWYIHISLSIIAIILSILVLREFLRLRQDFKGRLTSILTVFGVVLLAQFFSFLTQFILWSNSKEPMYIYPSLITIGLSFTSMVLFYYYVTKL